MIVQEEKITIRILDKEYPLEGTISEEQARQLEEYVDEKIRLLQEASPMVPFSRLAILACLNIAQEVFELNNAYKQSLKEYENRIDSIISTIDESLN
ncbi:MAG: cell division protein ZapA [Candidatus Auribacterota bacterium]|jgi:cell division protein ZapA (FtsZ GTPase activity inhibitor)|uniref:Cell division protein ZapA n=1 Tax=Candidatus Auribacter fodinae TaxID=2093366 RepID=A0A3A4R2G7_9BACT|nr:MAG: cell division protein ZapA [Candidatus Auribacter fodinae]